MWSLDGFLHLETCFLKIEVIWLLHMCIPFLSSSCLDEDIEHHTGKEWSFLSYGRFERKCSKVFLVTIMSLDLL